MLEKLVDGKRLDGRGIEDYRTISVETGIIEKANGSAKVTIGKTVVYAGVSVEIGKPFPDKPDQGLLIVNAELLPLSSPYAEQGPPSEEAIELARVTDRGVRESEMLDLSEMVLVEGDKVRSVFADVSIINVDGNLFDAVSYAVVSALSSAKIEKLEIDEENNVVGTGELVPLPISTIPISITQARIEDTVIVDPTTNEEEVMNARITLTSNGDGNFCAGQKGFPSSFTPEQIIKASETALAKSGEIRKIIQEAIKNGKA